MPKTKVETKAEKTVEVAEPKAEVKAKAPEYVVVTLPKDRNKNSEPQYVMVNGQSYLIPRGKPISVPMAVYKVLLRAKLEAIKLETKKDGLVS